MKPASKKTIDLDAVIASRINDRSPDPAALDSGVNNIITLNVRDECRLYERNPRSVRNEKYDEIKESIRKRGVDNIVSVTQRPGEKHYFPAKGGNTRLEILQELVAEGEARFLHTDFIRVPYPGEAALLAAHMVENDQRSGLTFWDQARSTFELKAEIERERGTQLSLREFSEYLKEQEGLRASPALLSHFGFAMKHLPDLSYAATHLSRRDVQDRMIPARSRLALIASKLNADDALDDAWMFSLNYLRERYIALTELDVGGFLKQLEQTFAQRVDLSETQLQRVSQLIELDGTRDASSILEEAKRKPSEIPASTSSDNAPNQVEKSHSARSEKDAASAKGNATTSASTLTQPFVETSPDDGAAAALQDALEQFAAAHHLSGCLKAVDELPLRFMVDVPDNVGHDFGSLQEQALQGSEWAARYYAWWWLVLLSQQNTPAGLLVIPDTAFKTCAETTDSWEEACNSLLGDPIYADGSYHVVRRMTDAHDAMGALYLAVVQAVRRHNAAYPERCGSCFWESVGVPTELSGGTA